MAFYFSSDTNALYDTDVFPVASLPANKVEITSEAYAELLTKQNQGYVILADGSGNPYTVNQSEASATDINHAASVATTLALGHVKIGNTMEAANDGTLDLKNGAVTTAKIVDANVTADKLASNSVTTAKITDANVTADKLASNSVTTAKIADGAVTTAKIVDANVTADKLASNSVTTAKITDANVTADKLASDSVTSTKIADGAVTTAKIVDANVTADKLASNSVTTAKITDANVTADKLASNSVTTAKIADGAVTDDKLASGAVTYNKIASNSVDTSHIVNGAVSAAKMGYDAVQTPSLADNAVTTVKIADNAVTTSKIADANVTTAKIADGAVTEAKLEAVKDLVADETSLTITETSNEFTLAVKDGGVSHEKLESTFMFWDPNYVENHTHPKSETTLTSYCTNNCDGKPASIVFLEGITSFTLSNGLMINSERAYKNGSMVLVYNDDDTNTLDVYHDTGSALPSILIDSIPPNKCKLFVCLISLPLGVSQWKSIS